MPPLFVTINIWAVVCLILGMVLMTIEIFTPGFGVAGSGGILFMVIAIILQAKSFLEAVILAAAMLIVLSIVFVIAMRSAQKGRLSRSPIILKDAIGKDGAETESLLGLTGKAITPLRPTGTADFSGLRISVVTRGEYIDMNTMVTITGTDGVTPVVQEYLEEEA
ncbi:hypothetical protein LJC20_03620 [Eubacteriales bacterium OttesenSCG-928-M02]|nr:hypothetical protein [Eubacteriales bacterium OttesenSCG-928-M02]